MQVGLKGTDLSQPAVTRARVTWLVPHMATRQDPRATGKVPGPEWAAGRTVIPFETTTGVEGALGPTPTSRVARSGLCSGHLWKRGRRLR